MTSEQVFSFVGMLAHLAVSPLIIMVAIAATEMAAVFRLAARRGDTIHKSRNRSLKPAAGLLTAVGFVAYLNLQWDGGGVTAAISFLAVSVPLIPFALRGAFMGLYENLVVTSNFICGWDKIEAIEKDDGSLRLVHRSKGAGEYRIRNSELDTIYAAAMKLLHHKATRTSDNTP